MRLLAAVFAASFLNLMLAAPVMAASRGSKAKKSSAKQAAATQLEVVANVNDATVMLDGDVIGRTPLRPRAVAAKAYTLTVKKLGYLELEQRITVTAGQTLRVNADLMPFAGVIHVTSNFAGAQVAVDGRVVGTAPLDYEVKLGNRVVSVTAAGFPAFTQVVHANPGETHELRAVFGNKPGQIAALPLEVEPATPEPSKDGGDLALVPLEAPPSAQPSMELPLEPVDSAATPSLVPPLAPPSDSGELALEMPGVDTTPQLDLAPLTPMGLNQQVPPAKPWYREWWAYAAAGGVAAIAITSIILISKGHHSNERGYDVLFPAAPAY